MLSLLYKTVFCITFCLQKCFFLQNLLQSCLFNLISLHRSRFLSESKCSPYFTELFFLQNCFLAKLFLFAELFTELFLLTSFVEYLSDYFISLFLSISTIQVKIWFLHNFQQVPFLNTLHIVIIQNSWLHKFLYSLKEPVNELRRVQSFFSL